MPKEFDKQVLITTIIKVLASNIDKMLHVPSFREPEAVETEIIESDGYMRVFPMEKFNGPCFVSIINFYLSRKRMDDGQAVGTFILYIKEDIIEKFLRAFNRSLKDAEHEDILMDICGEICSQLAGGLKNELSGVGYADLILSAPNKYKNHVPEGAQFDFSLFHKQEISFFYWGQKCIVVDACLGYLPAK